MGGQRGPGGEPERGPRRSGSGWLKLLLPAVAAILVALIGVLAREPPPPPPPPQGEILTPKDGAWVGETFDVMMTVSNLPPGRHVWIAAQRGNLIWPKEHVIAGRSLRTVTERRNPSQPEFALVLLTVGRQGQRLIEDWLHRGKGGAGFPGLRPDQLKDSTLLHTVQVNHDEK